MAEREIARKKEAARKARKERERKARNRRIVLTMCLLIVVCVASIGGTIAWLTDSTGEVKNTFTASDVDIDLTETKPENKTAKMVPGVTIEKDPTVKVYADSEACWVFVKIEKSTDKDFDDYMTFEIADGWTELTAGSGIYYREVADTDADQTFAVLTDNMVTVKNTVTKNMMDAVTDNNKPTLSFTAYAIQKEGFSTASAAWMEINKK